MIGQILEAGLHSPIVLSGHEHEGVGRFYLGRESFHSGWRRPRLEFLVHTIEHGQTKCFGVDQLRVHAATAQP